MIERMLPPMQADAPDRRNHACFVLPDIKANKFPESHRGTCAHGTSGLQAAVTAAKRIRHEKPNANGIVIFQYFGVRALGDFFD